MLTHPPADHAAASDCETVRAHAFAACDGELTTSELATIDAHLAACEPCRLRVAADATFHGVVRAAVSLDTAPQSLRDRILLSLTTRSTADAPA